jgi:hypothetical protein
MYYALPEVLQEGDHMSNNDHTINGHGPTVRAAGITMRPSDDRDRDVLRRLAQLDSTQVPPAPLLVAEIEGQPVAAVSLTTGESFADPFSRTGEVRALLELRAAQLRRRDPEHRRRPRLRARRASRPAVAAGPPGRGPWLIGLLTRPF